MKNFTQILVACGLFGAAAVFVRADGPAINLVTVDMNKIFTTHYATIAEQAKLKSESDTAQSDYDKMRKDANDLYTQFNTAKDESTSPTASPEAQAKAKVDAQQLYTQLQQKAQDLQNFQNQARQQIQQQVQSFRAQLIDEISTTVKDIAKRHNATLVLDKSGPTLMGFPPVIYADPGYDITQEVIDEIAKNKPANTPAMAPAPQAAPAPAPSTGAPSSAPSSGFSIPNVTPQQ